MVGESLSALKGGRSRHAAAGVHLPPLCEGCGAGCVGLNCLVSLRVGSSDIPGSGVPRGSSACRLIFWPAGLHMSLNALA